MLVWVDPRPTDLLDVATLVLVVLFRAAIKAALLPLFPEAFGFLVKSPSYLKIVLVPNPNIRSKKFWRLTCVNSFTLP